MKRQKLTVFVLVGVMVIAFGCAEQGPEPTDVKKPPSRPAPNTPSSEQALPDAETVPKSKEATRDVLAKSNAKADAVPFAGNLYRVYLERRSWTRAAEECEALGGRLVCIETRDELDFVCELTDTALGGKGACWLGASDSEEEGKWRWLTGEPVDLAVFQDKQLFEQLDGETRDYLCLLRGHRITCREDRGKVNCFVCEWPLAAKPAAEETEVPEAQRPINETEPASIQKPVVEPMAKETSADDDDQQAPPKEPQSTPPAERPKATTPESKSEKTPEPESADPEEIKEFIDSAWRGNDAKLVEFLDKGMDIEVRDGDGYTALHRAASANKPSIVTLLLEKGANVMARNNFGQTPLHYPPSKEVAELLITHGADVNARGWDEDVPLQRARGEDLIEFLVAQGAHVNARDSAGKTPLDWRIWYRDTDAIMSLLALGADVNTWDRDGRTPLHGAAERDLHQVIPELLEKGAHIKARDYQGRTPLHEAARGNAKEAATLLIDSGAQMNAKDHAGHTPLDVAVAQKRQEVVQILEAKGGKPSDTVVPTGQGGNIFYWMAASAEQVKGLLDKGEKVDVRDRDGKTLLHKAAEQGNGPVIELLLTQGLDLNAKDARGCSPLHVAVLAGKTEAAELLLDESAKLDVFTAAALGKLEDVKTTIKADPTTVCLVDHEANSLLHYAVLGGSKEAVELLIKNGAQLEARNRRYCTPLLLAAGLGQPEIVDLLLTKEAYVSATVGMGQSSYMGTALHQAAREGHAAVVSLLLERGVDIEVRSKYGETPLHMACRSDTGLASGDKVKTAELLLDKNAHVNAANKEGHTPLLFASPWSEKLARLLLDRGADVNAKGQYQRTVLHSVNSKEMAELLIAKGADVNARDEFGETPLFQMMYPQKREMAELLIEKGADVNAKGNTSGNHNADTPLHCAARGYGMEGMVELLLKKGANPNVEDKNGQTPLAIAEEGKQAKVIEVLKKHGAK